MNKKIISFVTAFFMIFTLFDFPAGAVNGFTIEDDTLKNYYGDGGDVVVPDGVKHIADMAFLNESNITSVTLPNSITSIGESAFAGCTSLTEITIPAGVTAIEPFVFDGCQNLQNVTFHDNVESIGEFSFRQCSMTSLHIPDSVKTIGANAFAVCKNLQTVNIPNGIEAIEYGIFQGCSKLSSIEIPDSVKAIGYYAFSSCEALTSITIPDSVEEIGEGAFLGCTGLTSINIPSSVTSIGSMAFYNCYYLDMITYPKELDVSNAWFPAAATKVEYTVENGEVTITDIILGAGTGETEVEIPETINGVPVTSVDESVRDKVSESGHVHRYVDGTCTMCNKPEFDYKVINENEIRIDGYNGSNTEVVIPETIDGKTVTTIYELNGDSITKVTIPKSVKMIYGAAFNYNKPSSLAEICFDGFSDGFVTVGTSAFPDTVTKITFPEGLNDRDIMEKMTLTVFPANAELFSGTEPLPHDYVYVPDGSVHYQKCDACGHVKENSAEAHAPEGEFITDNPNYDYEKYHHQKCKCGMVMSKFHEWDEGSITTQATCTSTGVMTYICACGAVKTEEISKLPHSYENGSCTVCGEPDPDYSQPTDTEPPVTEPPVTDSSDTDSTVTEPPVTDPSDTEPTGTQPPVTEPSDTEPTGTQPPVTEPSDTEPTGTQPPVTEPPVTEPTGTQPPITEPIVTPAPSYPSYIPPLITTPSAGKEPYIYGDNGKIGWEAISDTILSTPDGGTVTVKMNGTTKLPKDIVFQIQDRDIDLVLDMGSGFSWTINGMNVTKAKTVDMRVRKISKIPKSVVDKYFDGLVTTQIDLAHNGDFGFIAELTINIGNKYNGMYANSYCYKSRKFEFGDSGEIVNGQAKLRFAHASSWLITVESSPVLEDVSSAAAAHSSGTPIEMSNSAGRGITVPDFDFEKKLRLSNKKRRYRILKKRRLDDLVFVF